MPKNVGEGISNALAENQDEAWRDSDFGSNGDGSKWEKGYGFKGLYVAGQNDKGEWKTTGPFPYSA